MEEAIHMGCQHRIQCVGECEGQADQSPWTPGKLKSLDEINGLCLAEVQEQKGLAEQHLEHVLRCLPQHNEPQGQYWRKQCKALQGSMTNIFHPHPSWPLDSDSEDAHRNALKLGIIMCTLADAAAVIARICHLESTLEAHERVDGGQYVVQLCHEIHRAQDLFVKVKLSEMESAALHTGKFPTGLNTQVSEIVNAGEICQQYANIILAFRRIRQLRGASCHHPVRPGGDRH